MLQFKTSKILVIFLAALGAVLALALPKANIKFCGIDNENFYRNKRYTIKHSGHPKNNISYKVTDYSKNLTHEQVDDVLKRAFNLWTQFADLTFKQNRADENVDIDIGFYVGYHGDNYPFDGPGHILAHATREYVHFDDEEIWKSNNEEEGTSLYRVAIHEIGHSLGLSHSSEPEAIMFEFHDSDDEYGIDLHEDDIQGIQQIYGKKISRPVYDLDLCKDPSFDTMFNTPDGKTYVFKTDKYYEMEGTLIADGPKPIADKWIGLPDSIDGAFTQNGKTFFFKRDKYWRFTGYKMDKNYPIELKKYYSEIPDGIDDVTMWEDGRVYFFRTNKVYTMDQFNEQCTNVTEKFIVDEWKGIPNRINAVHFDEHFGSTFFFKGDSFYIYRDAQMRQEPYLIPTNSYFFGCIRH